MTKTDFIQTLNNYGSSRIPFLFLTDFELQKPVVLKLSEVDPTRICYDIEGFSNVPDRSSTVLVPKLLTKEPISFAEYRTKFSRVYAHLSYGDSYLTNLTVKTRIKLNITLSELFQVSRAKYRLLIDNEFLVFSPECFVKIKDGHIFSFPMKGTIDASIPNATEIILNDRKELAEHVTIVDLIRNDLSLIASNVRVTRFRYIDELKTNQKNLLQVSSEIRGKLPERYEDRLGDIVASLLPAGSVSGAPKPRTIEIIRAAENEDRGYYTGVFGYFNGTELNSGVMIRFIEQSSDGSLYYRSGGGITTQSIAEDEYQEIIDKVYVPVD